MSYEMASWNDKGDLVEHEIGHDTFTCASCGGTFDKVWSDEEAISESVELWGEMDAEDLAVICDGCFRGLPRATEAPA